MIPSFFKKLGPHDINKIKSIIDCDAVNLSNDEIFRDFVSIDRLEDQSLSFLYDSQKINHKLSINSTLVCTKKKVPEFSLNQKLIIVKDVQKSAAILSNLFYRDLNKEEKDNLNKPSIGKGSHISKSAIIENGVVIGNNVNISNGCVIKYNCVIGNGTKIDSNSVVSNSIIGENVNIGSNSSIGQRGFGFYLSSNGNIDIYHTGKVIIHSHVSIGAGCTIDRGSFSDTIIGENTYFDNLCHVAHNVVIGNNCAFAAMTGIAGSAKVGNNVLTGGQAGIAGHISIGNNVHIAAKSGVFNDLNDGEQVMGNPATNKYKFIKNYKKIYEKK